MCNFFSVCPSQKQLGDQVPNRWWVRIHCADIMMRLADEKSAVRWNRSSACLDTAWFTTCAYRPMRSRRRAVTCSCQSGDSDAHCHGSGGTLTLVLQELQPCASTLQSLYDVLKSLSVYNAWTPYVKSSMSVVFFNVRWLYALSQPFTVLLIQALGGEFNWGINSGTDLCSGEADQTVGPHLFFMKCWFKYFNILVWWVFAGMPPYMIRSFFFTGGSTMPWQAQFHRKYQRWQSWAPCMSQNRTF